MNRHDRIGVFDSGVGGLELLDQLQRILPDEEIYYFADTVNNPYGERRAAEIERFLSEIIEGMLLRRVKLLVIACHTASVVFDALPESHPLKRHLRRAGVDVVPIASAGALLELVACRPKRVLLTGTRLTMESGVYPRLLNAILPEAQTVSLPAAGWVQRVERPDPDPIRESALRRQSVTEVLGPQLDPPPDALFLGCTHFPRLADEIREAVGPACAIINPAISLAYFVRDYLKVRALDAPANTNGDAPKNTARIFTNGPQADIIAQLTRMGLGDRFQVRQVDIRNDLSGKQVEIVGYGATGRSLLRHVLRHRPARLVVRDADPAARLAIERDVANAAPTFHDLEIITGEQYLDGVWRADVVLRSPGVPADRPAFARARSRGVPVMGDIDLFLRRAPGRKVAISGTNGKTTTTLLTHRFFEREYGSDVHLVGNIGRPVLDDLPKLGENSVCAIELSSFQLEELTALPVEAAILLNITPDHLDRHGDLRGYTLAKGRLFTLLDKAAFAVYNIDSEPIVNTLLPQGCRARMVPFSRSRRLEHGAFIEGPDLVLRYGARPEWRFPAFMHTRRFTGEHNLENLMGSALAAYLLGVSDSTLTDVVQGFSGVRYRIEHFHRHQGVDFYDDSKGTNPDATIKAVEALTMPIRLVAGGVNKGTAFDDVARACSGRVAAAYLFGDVASALDAAFCALAPPISVKRYTDLESATRAAADDARSGEAVLFSPACASPAGEKYYQRGDRFKRVVQALGPNECGDGLEPLDDPLAAH